MIKIKKCKHGAFLYPDTDIYIGKSLDTYGEYASAELAMFSKFIKPGMVAVDIGAHIGAITVPLARMVGPKGKVMAFEPQRYIYYHLCANVVLNNLMHVKCNNVAVGETNKKIEMPELPYLDFDDNYGNIKVYGNNGDNKRYLVQQIRLDGLKFDRLDFIKIDVERMELEVLAGAKDTIKKHKPVISIEALANFETMVNLLQSWGYTCHPYASPLYHQDNFLGNAENVFGRDENYDI